MGKRPGYFKIDGERVPSTTTITGRYKETGALMWWANQVGLGEHESCNDQERCAQCGRRAGKQHREVATAAADVGTYAHALIDEAVLGTEIDEADFDHLDMEQREAAGNCLDGFQRWRDSYDVTFLDTELRLVSEKHRFGGMIDSIARLENGALILPDWKTSNGLYADYIAQIAAYGILVDESDLFGPVEEFHILRISKETASFNHHSWRAEVFQPAKDWFLQARALYALEAPLKKLLK
jgi:hypothetical protein